MAWPELGAFDEAMLCMLRTKRILGSPYLRNLWQQQGAQLLCYEKGGVLFLFNWHPSASYNGFFLPTGNEGRYRVTLDTDEPRFGGQGRVSHDTVYEAAAHDGLGVGFQIYLPARTALVMEKVD